MDCKFFKNIIYLIKNFKDETKRLQFVEKPLTKTYFYQKSYGDFPHFFYFREFTGLYSK